MSIKTVNVFLNHYNKKISVGKLAYKDRVIYFEYSAAFLDSELQLSPYKLPLRRGVFVCDDNVFEGLFGLFGDSLPDGWGRLLLDRHFLKQGIKYSEITPLDRLSYIGKYGTGALSFEPIIDDILIKDTQELHLDELSSTSMEILRGSSEEMIDNFLSLGGSSAGARPKVMIQLSDDKKEIIHAAQALQTGFTHYLVKFPSATDTIDVGKLEYAYSLMAQDAKVEMSQTTLLSTEINSYFATKRFDRNLDERIHIHSVAGLAHSDFRIPTVDYDDLLTLTLDLTKDIKEQMKMFRLAVFNLYSHNRDDHAKNFSFLLNKEHIWKLAPAYDLTFSYGPGGEHSTTYLGEGKNPTKEMLLNLANKHNIKNAELIINEIKSVIDTFTDYAQKAGLNKSSIKSISSILKQLN